LLLGGDTSIVPVREVAGGREGVVNPGTKSPPDKGASFWIGSHLNINITDMGVIEPKTMLVHQNTGEITPYVYVPPRDWDAIGMYGQNDSDGNDRVVPHVNISVRRATVDSAAEADTFLGKTLAYELLEGARF
jgi:hypothetical protein